MANQEGDNSAMRKVIEMYKNVTDGKRPDGRRRGPHESEETSIRQLSDTISGWNERIRRKYVKQLERSVQEWNIWRQRNPEIRPWLSGADLSHLNLSSVDLSNTDMSNTKFFSTNLRGANLSGANFLSAEFTFADLNGANLNGARLSDANLGYAKLDGVDFSNADLDSTNFKRAKLNDARFHQATFDATILAWVDLSSVKGLETTKHKGPSSLDLNSVILPHDESTRLHFLRGVGFTETRIEYLSSLLAPWPIEYSSLFISYASQDETIANDLYRFTQKGCPLLVCPP